jgi:hypothetical protein
MLAMRRRTLLLFGLLATQATLAQDLPIIRRLSVAHHWPGNAIGRLWVMRNVVIFQTPSTRRRIGR